MDIKEITGLWDYSKLPANVRIGQGARIGACTTIMAGSRIGKGAIIGVGSVVFSHIPDYAVAAGNPASVVGTLLSG